MQGRDQDSVFFIENPESHEPCYFAMLNNAVALAGTSLEGGKLACAIAYYRYLLHVKLPNCPLDFNLSQQQVQALKKGMANLVVMNDILLVMAQIMGGDEFMQQLLQTMDEQIKDAGVCYLPCGWVGKPGEAGHFAGLKCRRLENGHYALSIINKGEGARYHAQIILRQRNKCIYQSHEYEVDLHSKNGHQLLQHLLELLYDANNRLEDENTNAYSADDLYGLLKIVGKELPLKDKLNEKIASYQRAGTCTVTNLHAIAQDILVDHGADAKACKRYQFVVKLKSIITEYDDYLKGKCPHNVMDWALREFAVRMSKEFRHNLSEEEMIWCGNVLAEIRKKLAWDTKNNIRKKIAATPFPKTQGYVVWQKDLLQDSNVAERKIEQIKEVKRKKLEKIRQPDPEEVLSFLKKADKANLFEKLNVLPHASGIARDPYWSKVPVEDIPEIYKTLASITCDLDSASPPQKAKIFSTLLIAYDIAAQLSFNFKELKLINIFRTSYTPALDDIYSEQTFYTDPEVYYTVKRIASNFDLRNMGKKRIFSNSVSLDNQHDATIQYLIREILGEAERNKIVSLLRRESASNQKEFTDQELFGFIMKKPHHHLHANVITLMHLSRNVHCLRGRHEYIGMDIHPLYLEKKDEEHGKTWVFEPGSNYHSTLSRKEKFHTLKTANLIPEMNKEQGILHQDFSENILYSSQHDLKIVDKKLRPWQTELSGSLKPDSKEWIERTAQSREIDEELRHIECTPSLQISRILAYASKHPEKLQHSFVRERINQMLFEYGKLDNALGYHTEATIFNMQQFFNTIIRYCETEAKADDELLIWAATLSHYLCSWLEVAASIYDFSVDNLKLPQFRQVLLKRIQASHDAHVRAGLAHLMMLEYKNTRPLDFQDYATIIICRLMVNQGNISSDTATENDALWQKWSEEINQAMEQGYNKLVPELKRLMMDYLNIPDKKWWLLEHNLIGEDLNFYIDLDSGSLKKAGISLKDYTRILIDNNPGLFQQLNLSDDNVSIYLNKSSESTTTLPFISANQKWEFITCGWTENYKIEKVRQILSIEGRNLKFELMDKDSLKQVFDTHNPFESLPQLESYYQYWQSMDDPDLFFIKDKKTEFAFWYSIKTRNISQLAKDDHDNWERNGKMMLNLSEGAAPLTYQATKMEKAWAKRLSPLIGSKNIRCMAELSENRRTCHLQRIEILLLQLQFNINDKQQLMSENYPGYFLSDKASIEELSGFPGVILLENEDGEQKILLPAYAFNPGEKNNAFNQEMIVTHEEVLKTSRQCYELRFDKHHELHGDSIEANLYLALVYRSMGDFRQAFKCLELCHGVNEITPEMAAILFQVKNRKICSPMSAAFNLKLQCLLKEKKWARKHMGQKYDTPEGWDEWIGEQGMYYYNVISLYKNDISILPDYCRLTEAELLQVAGRVSDFSSPMLHESTKVPVRIRQANYHYYWLSENEKIWEKFISKLKNNLSLNEIEPASPSLRLPNAGKHENPGLKYLIQHFNELLRDALSRSPEKTDSLKARLFSLLQNDASLSDEIVILVPLLVLTMKYPDHFTRLAWDDDPFKMILNVGKIVCKDSEIQSGLKKMNLALIEVKMGGKSQIAIPLPLAFDHAPIPTHFAIPEIDREIECKSPLGKLFKQYFTAEYLPVAKQAFTLVISEFDNPGLIEQRLLKQYEKGHTENQKKMRAVYKKGEELNLDKLRNDLVTVINKDKTDLQALEKQLHKIANQIPLYLSESEQALAHDLLAQRASEQRHLISIPDLYDSFMHQDPGLLTRHNPFLTQENIEELYEKLADHALLNSRIDQVHDILKDLGGAGSIADLPGWQWQLIGEKLDKKRHFEIHEFPEFLIYEYSTKRILRNDQILILKKIIELIESKPDDHETMLHCLLQFAAGGGKTSVLIPILAARFARKGFLPVIFNTNELYQIGLEEIPANLRNSFNIKMEVIERELDHVWTEGEFRNLLTDLKRFRSEQKVILLKPVTWHSINICYKLHQLAEPGGVKGADDVLHFFKQYGVKLEDEPHLISDPLQKCIKCYGSTMQTIPADQISIMRLCYDHLMGNAKGSERIAKLAGIKAARKRSITKEELDELKMSLADIIIQETGLNDPDYKAYILQTTSTRPAFLNDLHGSQSEDKVKLAELLVFIRGFVQTMLPHLLSKKIHDDYGFSIHEMDLTAAPKHDKSPTTAHFGDPRLVAAFSTQLYHQHGLLPTHIDQLLDFMLKKHSAERKWNSNAERPTQAEEFLLNFVPASLTFHNMRDLGPAIREKLKTHPQFCKNPEVIKRFLDYFVLPQIKSPANRVSSTPAEFQAGFARSVMFDATPGPPEMYAYLKPENCFLDEAFEAQVIDTLQQLQNKRLCTFKKAQSPREFFSQFPPDLLESMTTLIDRGGLLSDYQAENVIEDYLGLGQKHAAQTAAFFSPTHLHLRTREAHVREEDIKGAALMETLKKQGIKPEDFLLFLFLDLAYTTGVDIKRPHHAKGGLTIGKGQTMTKTIQAVMRKRQMLDENAQSISFLMYKALYREIYGKTDDETFDPVKLFYWLIRNEAKELEPKIMNAAFQGIDQAITSLAFEQGGKLFKEELKEIQDNSAWNNYELDIRKEETEIVLRNYAEQLIKKFSKQGRHYNARLGEMEDVIYSLKIPGETREEINRIINNTAKLIRQLTTPIETSLNNEVLQELEKNVREELEVNKLMLVQSQFDAGSSFVYANERYFKSDSLQTAFDYPVLSLPQCEQIRHPGLHFNKEHFAVTEAAQQEKTLGQLKPIHMLLVKIEEGNTEYLACTAAGAEYYSWLLQHTGQKNAYPAYVLLSTEGDILEMSNNMNIAQCENLRKTNHCQQMLAYANFLNGKISNPLILSQLIQSYGWTKEQFASLCHAIQSVHVSDSPVALELNAELEHLFGWSEDSASQQINIHQRYRKPHEGKIEMPDMLHLQKIDLSKPQPGSLSPPIPHPQRGLNQPYLFDEPVLPIEDSADLREKYGLPEPRERERSQILQKTTKDVIFSKKSNQDELLADRQSDDDKKIGIIINYFLTMPNGYKELHQNHVPEMDMAIGKMLQDINKILESSMELPEQLHELQKMRQSFDELNDMLYEFYDQVKKGMSSDSYLCPYLKENALKAIRASYTNIANGEDEHYCKMYLAKLVDALQNLVEFESSYMESSLDQKYAAGLGLACAEVLAKLSDAGISLRK